MKINRLASEILTGRFCIADDYISGASQLAQQYLTGTLVNSEGEEEEEVLFIASPVGMQAIELKAAKSYSSSNPNHKTSAIMKVEGVLMRNAFCGSPGTMEMAQAIHDLNNNSSIGSLVLEMNTPGGNAYGVQEMAAAIKAFEGKTTAVINEGIAASGGMWLAAHCDEIVLCKPTDAVGSIGAMASFRRAKENDYFEVITEYAPQSKRKNEVSREIDDKGTTTLLREELRLFAQTFIDAVASQREIKTTKKENPFEGAMYSAAQAIELGLADRMGSMQEVLSEHADYNQGLNQSIHMKKQYAKVNAALQVEELESHDGHVSLNEEQVEALDGAIASAQTEATEAEGRATTAQQEVETANQRATDAEATVSERETAVNNLCSEHEVEVAEDASFTEKLTALGAHITALGAEDGGKSKKGNPKGELETEKKTGAMDMAFQKELNNLI